MDWNDKGKAEVWRRAWADVTNKYLAEQNIPQRIDHRSYERQGIEQIPTVHMGVAATQMERKGIVTENKGTEQAVERSQTPDCRTGKMGKGKVGRKRQPIHQSIPFRSYPFPTAAHTP